MLDLAALMIRFGCFIQYVIIINLCTYEESDKPPVMMFTVQYAVTSCIQAIERCTNILQNACIQIISVFRGINQPYWSHCPVPAGITAMIDDTAGLVRKWSRVTAHTNVIALSLAYSKPALFRRRLLYSFRLSFDSGQLPLLTYISTLIQTQPWPRAKPPCTSVSPASVPAPFTSTKQVVIPRLLRKSSRVCSLFLRLCPGSPAKEQNGNVIRPTQAKPAVKSPAANRPKRQARMPERRGLLLLMKRYALPSTPVDL